MSFTGRVIGTSFCIGSKYDILYRQEKAVLTVCLYGSAKYIKAVCLEFYCRDGSLTGIAKGIWAMTILCCTGCRIQLILSISASG